MNEARKAGILKLLKGLETGDPSSVEVLHPNTYIQHNPQTQTGREGLAKLFARLAKTSPRVELVRLFSDGDFVFGHTEYDFSTRRIGFEVFRFEGPHTVEHWDNIQPRRGPNPAGRSMVDGPTRARDLEHTEANRERVRDFVQGVLVEGQLERLEDFVEADLIQHDPELPDGLRAWRSSLGELRHERLHRVLAEGDFVLAVIEAWRDQEHLAVYRLFRLEQGRIVEHWNTIEHVAPRSEWQHDNGKF